MCPLRLHTLSTILDSVKQMLIGLITKPRIEREVASVIDLGLCLTLIIFPSRFAAVFGIAYYLLRDLNLESRPLSFGKSLYQLRVVRSTTGQRIGWRMSLCRNLLSLVPILNIADFYCFVENGQRLYDRWLGLSVIKEENGTDNGIQEQQTNK